MSLCEQRRSQTFNRRGRPRQNKPLRDTGTPELVMKRLLHVTTESIDLCLAHDIITPEQHWCGIHLRWLYTLRFGAPSVRATDPTHLGGIDIKRDDPEWRSAREQEYAEALEKLGPRASQLVLSIAVYNERPAFLRHHHLNQMRTQEQRIMNERVRLQEGLDALSNLWQRPKVK